VVGISAFTSAGEADNWLISPALQIINSGTKLKWSASSLSGASDQLESYRVLLSTTGQSTGDFSVTLAEITAENSTQTHREVDLSDYAGQSVYIAYNQIGSDNYALTLDDITIVGPDSADAAALVSIQGDRYQNLNSIELYLEVTNVGANVITDLVVEGSINGDFGANPFNGLNILPQETILIPFAGLYPFQADKYEIIASMVSVNGQAISEEEKSRIVYVVENPPTKKFLYEETTSTTCGWCPEGTVQKELMKFKYSNEVINISVHTDDPMRNVLYDLGVQTMPGFSGLPSATINRKTFLSHDRVEPHFLEDFSAVAPMTMELQQAYNEETRELELTINSTAHTTLEENVHSYSFVILEDKVSGGTIDFAQANNYSAEASDVSLVGVDGVDWNSLSNPVPASIMSYDDVVRDVIGGFNGIEGSIVTHSSGDAFSFSQSYILSSAFDASEIWIVALAIDAETGEVVNAIEEQLLLDSEVKDLNLLASFKVYPNPAIDYVDMEIVSEDYMVAYLNVTNVLGQQLYEAAYNLAKGKNKVRVQLDRIPSGHHFLHIQTTDGRVSKALTILDR